MTRAELEGLGLTDAELLDIYRAWLRENGIRFKPPKVKGLDNADRELMRSEMYDLSVSAWYRDPGLP